MSNTSISLSIPDNISQHGYDNVIGYLNSPTNLPIGIFTPTFTDTVTRKSNVNISIDNDTIGGFADGVNSDGYSMVTFPSTMSKARITLPDLTIESKSTWSGDGTLYVDAGIGNMSYGASVTLDFRLVVVDGGNTELANVSYGSEVFRVSDPTFGSSTIGFEDPTLSPATSTVDITLGANKNISFKLHYDASSTHGTVYGQYF